MKAIFTVPGPDGGVFEYRDIPMPSPAQGEVLIAIRAAGTNRGEIDPTSHVLEVTRNNGADAIIDQVGGPMLADNIRLLAIKGRLVSVGRNAGRVGECNLDEVARKRASIIGVTFRTRSAEEALQCSERFAAQMLGAVSNGELNRCSIVLSTSTGWRMLTHTC